MPPKVKITKEEIINKTLELIRENGEDAVNARTIASALGCSTQPIFSNFESMEDLYAQVINAIYRLYTGFIENELRSEKYPPYKAYGMAYIHFAKEEKELFKLLYMRDRSKEADADSIDSDLNRSMVSLVQENTGLESQNANLFHLEMWAYVHGIATMFATGFLDLDWELVSKMLTDSYQGLRKQYGME